ncbi:MAG: tetratricopeptide repeat protein [Myxococcota bacterium]
MNGPLRSLFLALLALLLLVAFALPAQAQRKPWSGASIVRDPDWQKRFLGSYGFLSGAEPEIDPSELEVLKEVIELMKSSPRAAATVLQSQTGEGSSAALDFILANLHFQNGKTDQAIERYALALEKFPDFRRARKNLGLLMVQLNEYEGAIEQLTRAIELGERDGRAYGLLGYCYVNQDNFLAAEAAYRNAILHQPDSKDWQLGLARSLNALEKFEESAALFSAFLEKHPDDAQAWKLQANAFLGLDEPLAAAVNLEAVRLLGRADAATLELLGDIYMSEGISDLAKEAYLEVIEIDEKGARFETAYRAAELLHRGQANADAAEMIDSIDRRYGERLSTDEALQLLTLDAKVERARGNDEAAAKLLESIIDRDGTRGDALLELAAYHRDQGNDQRALLILERAQKLEKYAYAALLQRAQFQVAAREYEQAARLLRQALRIRREPRIERYLARIEDASRR